jgi:hypothetical protein
VGIRIAHLPHALSRSTRDDVERPNGDVWQGCKRLLQVTILDPRFAKCADQGAQGTGQLDDRPFAGVETLIDAVIAWENLCGATPETTFRTTASLSWLLEPDASKRRELRTRLGKVYGARSQIVHGQATETS